MKIILGFVFIVATISNCFSQIKFPESNVSKGYELSDLHARVAYPIDGQGRVWVKGSSEKSIAKILNSNTSEVIAKVELKPPFYTDVVSVNSKTVKVTFCDSSNTCEEYATLYPGHFEDVKGGNFSILIYGCLEPFMVEYKNEKPVSGIFEDENNSSYRVRSLFEKIATEKSVSYSDSIKKDYEYIFNGKHDSTLLKGSPKMILTTGDQVYVDAGYGDKMKKDDMHPLSAWETKRRPKPFNNSLSHYEAYLNKLYNASYSFSGIEAAHRRLPLLPAIDDHELRDGWGSQGDEYEKGIMNPELAGQFKLGKQAYIEHQLFLSNYPEEEAKALSKENTSMEYSFQVNGKNGYVFDLRSARNINDDVLLGEKQWANFEKWLASLERNQEIILLTSVPVTLRPLKWIEDVAKLFKPELRDDVRDGWSSKHNIASRNRLIELLTTYRIEKDIKPIFVSGDIHKSALIEIWVDKNVGRNSRHDIAETMILGYEVVASGISHEFIKTGVAKSVFKLLESQRIGDGFIDFTYKGNRASIYPMVRNSMVTQNFAAIEFSETENTKIHTFIYDVDSDSLQQLYLDLDFDKKLPDDDYYRFHDESNKKNAKKSFAPPIPHGKRIIVD